MMPDAGLCRVIPFTQKPQIFHCSTERTLAQTLGPVPRIKGTQVFLRPGEGMCGVYVRLCHMGPRHGEGVLGGQVASKYFLTVY